MNARDDPWKPRLPKRFYNKVDVRPGDDGHEIVLDGRPVRTPLKNPLTVASSVLCDAIATEWDLQVDFVDPARMPLTRLANAAVDRVAPRREAVVEEIVSYGSADLVCYRAEGPDSLILRQAQLWDPVVSWAEAEIGARFVLVQGIVHHAQTPETITGLTEQFGEFNPFELTGLHNITTLTGSALVAIAIARGRVSGDAAWALAHVDEDWQIEQWGHDEEAEARRARRRVEFNAAVRFVTLARGEFPSE